MKKFVLTSLLAAVAAPAPACASPIFTWSGFHLGAQVGYAWGDAKFALTTPLLNDSRSPVGALGGVHAGYNLQVGSFVAGVEGDLELADARGSAPYVIPTVGNPLIYVFGSRMGAQGSARLRAGYAVDRALFYVTGGVAQAKLEYSGFHSGSLASVSRARLGYTVGAGVEYALTDRISARAEYRFTDFRKSGVSFRIPLVIGEAETSGHAIRVGVSFRLGGGL